MTQADDITALLSDVTPEAAAQEIRFRNYSARHWTIGTKSKGFQPFNLTRCQQLIDAEIERQLAKRGYVRLDLLKPRQAGGTTYLTKRAMHYCMVGDARTAMTLADKKETPAEWLARCQRNYDETPEVWRPKQAKGEAGHQIAFANGSRYYIGSAQGGFPGVGDTIHYLHISEVCWWDKPPISKDPDEVLSPLWPSVPKGSDRLGSHVYIDSTGVTVGDWRHKHWLASKSGDNDFFPLFVPWYVIEEYRRDDLAGGIRDLTPYESELVKRSKSYGLEADKSQLAWRRHTIQAEFHGDEAVFSAAYPSDETEAFAGAGQPEFTAQMVQAARETIRKPLARYELIQAKEVISPEFELHGRDNGRLIVFEEPQRGLHYVVGADNRLCGDDFNASTVECIETGRVVAVLHGKWDTALWACQLAWAGYRYNTALLAPESNHECGRQVRAILLGQSGNSWRYPNMWVGKKDAIFGSLKVEDYGFNTSDKSKARLIAGTKRALLDGEMDWAYEPAVTELSSIIRPDDGNPCAPEGMHDDLWMARMITHLVSSEERATGKYTEVIEEPVIFRGRSMADRVRSMGEDDGGNEGD